MDESQHTPSEGVRIQFTALKCCGLGFLAVGPNSGSTDQRAKSGLTRGRMNRSIHSCACFRSSSVPLRIINRPCRFRTMDAPPKAAISQSHRSPNCLTANGINCTVCAGDSRKTKTKLVRGLELRTRCQPGDSWTRVFKNRKLDGELVRMHDDLESAQIDMRTSDVPTALGAINFEPVATIRNG